MIRLFYNDTFKNYFLLMISIFVQEIMIRFLLGLSLFSFSMLRIFVGANLIALILSGIYSFFGRIISNTLTFITGLFFTLYALIQVGFGNYLGSFFSLSEVSQFGAVQDYIGEFFSSFSPVNYILFIPVILMGLFYITCDHRIKVLERNDEIDFADKFDSVERKQLNERALYLKKKNRYRISKSNALIISIFFGGIYFFLLNNPLMINNLQLVNNYQLFLNPDMPYLVMEQFGYTGYLVTDIKELIKPYKNISDSEYNNGFNKVEQVESDYIRRIDDTMWEKIIENEGSNYKTLSNYYISQEITDKNDLTGFFKDKNLIMIAMPVVNNIIINKEYYPNIYKLYNNGWSFENSYSSNTICNGIDSEIVALTGLYTLDNVCTGVKYSNTVYPYSLFELFKNSEYSTSSYHNYTEQFYKRSVVHKNMGVDEYYGVQSLGIPFNSSYNEWPSDSALMEKVLKNIKNKEKFMIHVTTSGTNFPYDVNSELGEKNIDLFADTGYDITLRRYMSKLKELDNAIGVLIKGLEEQDIIDDTVIILYSTGRPYGINNGVLKNYFEYDKIEQNNLDKTPFIIYNTLMQGQIYKEYMSTINIVPTVANLFNLSYDPRYYAAKDIFANTYDNRVIFKDGSWKDNIAYYNSQKGKVTYYDPNKTYSDSDILDINKIVRNRIYMSNIAIKNDYFNHLAQMRDELTIKEIEEQDDKEE